MAGFTTFPTSTTVAAFKSRYVCSLYRIRPSTDCAPTVQYGPISLARFLIQEI
jgi:hypothetical protein